jgi:hypothetical protein
MSGRKTVQKEAAHYEFNLAMKKEFDSLYDYTGPVRIT